MKPIELDKPPRDQAIASLKRYFEENLPEPIGDLPAGLLLDYFLQEIGPLIYNQAVQDAQARIVQRASDLPGELFAEEFQYWPNQKSKRRR